MLEEMINRGPLLIFGMSAMGAGRWRVSFVRQVLPVPRAKGRAARIPESLITEAGLMPYLTSNSTAFSLSSL